MSDRFAILLDGGFVSKVLGKRLRASPSAQDVIGEITRIRQVPVFSSLSFLRAYYYDAPPAKGTLRNPIDGSMTDLGTSAVHSRGMKLLEDLELSPEIAVRRGELVTRGWTIGKRAASNMLRAPRSPTAQDLVPNIQQKGVDLRIGLDIALLSLRRLVNVVVVVTGDSDLVPAFKFARREGVRVFLDHLGNPIRPELKAHTDWIL